MSEDSERKINGELIARAQVLDREDAVTAELLRDAADEIDRLRGLLLEATQTFIDYAPVADRIRAQMLPLKK